ncbi:hypothetical protein Tco_0956493 [Tanacetum coccineum]
MAGLQCNKFREDKGKIILVLLIRTMLQFQREILQRGREELLNATTAKVKDIWLGNALSLSDQGILHDPGILASQAQTVIPHNAAFHTDDLDTYDSEFVLALQDFKQSIVMDFTDNEISSDSNKFKISILAPKKHTITVQDTNLQAQQDSMILSVIEQMSEQMINHVNNWEKANKEQNNESITAELERYKERVKTFEQRLNIDLSSREKMIDSQMDDMIREKLALKEQIDSLEQNLSKQIKEKESVLQTLAVFKNESKEKENKYMENEIDLENKIKELDNIICKVGQSAQTVHMLTKPQALLGIIFEFIRQNKNET